MEPTFKKIAWHSGSVMKGVVYFVMAVAYSVARRRKTNFARLSLPHQARAKPTNFIR